MKNTKPTNTHKGLIDNTECDGSVQFETTEFSQDISWKIYKCDSCNKYIYAVGGYRHHWNYERFWFYQN